MRRILTLAVLLSALALRPAHAEDRALGDVSRRLSIAAGANYEGFSGEPVPGFIRKEFTAGLFAGYPLTQHVKLAASSVYGFDSTRVRTAIGIRIQLKHGGE